MDPTLTRSICPRLTRLSGAALLCLGVMSGAHAAPQVDGDIRITNSQVGTVVVLPPRIKLGIGLGSSGQTKLNVSIPIPLKPANINSVVLLGNGHVGGNIVIDGATSRRMLLPNGSNVNSVYGR